MSEKYQRSPEPPQQAVALRQASPRINSPNVLEYQYKPLALDKIRVLVLLPGEFSSPLQGYIVHGYYDRSACELSYEALSYTWGGQATPETFRVLQHPNENSSTEGRIIKIGKNLETALRHLRQTSGTRTIWCDAMCINQNDLDERAIQVRGMGDIYRRANRVVVWLGPETDTLYRAMQILKFLGSIFYYDFERYKIRRHPDTANLLPHDWSPIHFHIADWHSIYGFFDLTWFKRLWVKQEIILASDSIFMIGRQELSWDDFCGAACYLSDVGLRHTKHWDEPKRKELKDLLEQIYFMFSYGENRHIAITLELANRCECLDPRDKIYGILGLHEELHVEPDYKKDHRDVYTDFCRAYINSEQSLGFFSICNTADDASWKHPTWVPDFAKPIPSFSFWIVGSAARWATPQQPILQDDSCHIHAVHCGTISRCSTTMPTGILPSDCHEVIKVWIREAFNRAQVYSHIWLDELVCTILLGNTKEHDINTTWTLSDAKDILLHDIGWYRRQQHQSDSIKELLISDIIHHGIGGTSLASTVDGGFALSVGTAQAGDEIYVIPGVDDPIILRSVGGGRYRVVGPCFIRRFMRGEALLGHVPEGWKMRFSRLRDMAPVFTGPDGRKQNQDPRLGELPPGWEDSESWNQGVARFTDPEGLGSWHDPRMTVEKLRARGVKFEELLIV